MVIDFPLTFAPLMQLAGLAARRGVWLDMHAEPHTPDGTSREDEVFGGIGALFARHPKLKLILSHTGMTNAANARALLRRYPNLMMNFKMTPPGGRHGWNNLEPIVNRHRLLFRDWAALMEDMPKRFMVGTDWRFGDKGFEAGRYARQIRLVRRVLGSLSPAVAELIAHDNAERLRPAFRGGP
jgi:predicted TIM-barrel fold metal-dependent hydrolase